MEKMFAKPWGVFNRTVCTSFYSSYGTYPCYTITRPHPGSPLVFRILAIIVDTEHVLEHSTYWHHIGHYLVEHDYEFGNESKNCEKERRREDEYGGGEGKRVRPLFQFEMVGPPTTRSSLAECSPLQWVERCSSENEEQRRTNKRRRVAASRTASPPGCQKAAFPLHHMASLCLAKVIKMKGLKKICPPIFGKDVERRIKFLARLKIYESCTHQKMMHGNNTTLHVLAFYILYICLLLSSLW